MEDLKIIIKSELKTVYNNDIINIAPNLDYDPLKEIDGNLINEFEMMTKEDIKKVIKFSEWACLFCLDKQKRKINKIIKNNYFELQKITARNINILKNI
ncbi:hypothetical protein EKK58_04280 [Candidatus Dependentiae bacterium]|nr:MAG: hypothetical protein EKK58_04280 [Candidatus Dependentiae bacterium]